MELLTKPFGMDELAARIRDMIRPTGMTPPTI
jgi:DNA-binding response OmpR family regulator